MLSKEERKNRFNSIVVQLKDGHEEFKDFILLCFNSIVVRLKGRSLARFFGSGRMFQFHSGSIKSFYEENAMNNPQQSFNSIVVRLKGLSFAMGWQGLSEFQFHSGSIKRFILSFSATQAT